MTTAVAVGDAAYPTPQEVRDAVLATIRFAYAQRGLLANVLPGSDHYIRAEAYGRRVSIAIANNKIALADISPLTAQGQGLIDLAGVFGVFPRPPGQSAGEGIIKCSTPFVTIPALFLATAPDGNKYQTTSLRTVATGQTVPLISALAGKATAQGAGTQLTWDSSAIGALNPILTVAAQGITGGSDGDVLTNPDGSLNVERLRQRLLRKLAAPAVGGNWSSVVEWAEEASSSVEFAFVYPAVRGPASYDVVVVGEDGVPLPSTILALVKSYIGGKMPGQNDLNVTSIVQQFVDVTLAATLPLPQQAGGAGGGWRDTAPWPAEWTIVTAYNATTGTATVNSVVSPVIGQQIGIWDPDAVDGDSNPAPVMHEYAIASVGGSTGAWTFTVQGGFGTFSPLHAAVSAGAVHLTDYAADLSAQFKLLGPGEKTTSPWVLPLGQRQPTTDVSSPSAISSVLLSVVEQAHTEISDIAYDTRYLTGTTTPVTGPSVALAPADPPNQIGLRYLALHA